jgi:hypothetical protein
MSDAPAICLECGEPLDDFSPCACALEQRGPRRPAPHDNHQRGVWSMREMVTRKLVKQGKR